MFLSEQVENGIEIVRLLLRGFINSDRPIYLFY